MGAEKTFGELFKELRKSKKMTLNKIATITGIDSGYLSRLERGEKDNPSAEIITKLANALETTTDYLLGRTDDPTPKIDNPGNQPTSHMDINDPNASITFRGKKLTVEQMEKLQDFVDYLLHKKDGEKNN